MKLRDAAFWARYHLQRRGLGHYNLIFYQMPSPLGFQYRDTIALSATFVVMNTMSEVWDTILHEIAHAKAPEGDGHGAGFKNICYRQMGIPAKEFHNDAGLSDEFKKLYDEYQADPARLACGQRAMNWICMVVEAEANEGKRKAGMRGTTDVRFVKYGTF